MENLKSKILQLPKEIQDYIALFNYEHRKIMKIICSEIDTIECDNCCNTIVLKKNSFKNNMMWENYYYCSEWCLNDHEYYFRKSINKNLK